MKDIINNRLLKGMVNLRSITLLCSIGMSLIIVTSILGLAHLTANQNLGANQNNVRSSLQNVNPSSENLKILNHQMTKPLFGSELVKGQVKNIGPTLLRYATINVNFYKNGNLIYTGSVTLNNIAPGEVKDFEVAYRGPDNSPDSYDLSLDSIL